MIDELADDLKSDEGWVEHAYQDHLGFWTLGYGFLIDERRGGRIPRVIADAWLRYEIEMRLEALQGALPWLHAQSDDVRRALGNMAYQLGVNGLLNFKRMLHALKAGERQEAAREALDSNWAEQTPARARRIAALISGNEGRDT